MSSLRKKLSVNFFFFFYVTTHFKVLVIFCLMILDSQSFSRTLIRWGLLLPVRFSLIDRSFYEDDLRTFRDGNSKGTNRIYEPAFGKGGRRRRREEGSPKSSGLIGKLR